MDGMVNEFYEPVECSALEPDEKEQMVSRAVFEQVMWERDIALKQLAEIGKGFGEKMDDVAPVAHGRWDGNDCTVCKLPWNYNMVQDADDWGYFDPMPDYCPNCGAKMDKEMR